MTTRAIVILSPSLKGKLREESTVSHERILRCAQNDNWRSHFESEMNASRLPLCLTLLLDLPLENPLVGPDIEHSTQRAEQG